MDFLLNSRRYSSESPKPWEVAKVAEQAQPHVQTPNPFDQFDALDAKPTNTFDQFDPPNQPPTNPYKGETIDFSDLLPKANTVSQGQQEINPYKGFFDDLEPEGNTSKPHVELDFEHLVPPENRNNQNQASTVDWSKFTPVDEPITDPNKVDWSQFTLVESARSRQEKKDLMIGSSLVVALLLLIYLGFRLWKKIASGHVGFKRLGILISGLWVGIHLSMNTIAELDYSGFEDKPWMEFVGITLVPNVLFWGLLWVAKGFKTSH